MFCEYCGSEIPPGQDFCPNCKSAIPIDIPQSKFAPPEQGKVISITRLFQTPSPLLILRWGPLTPQDPQIYTGTGVPFANIQKSIGKAGFQIDILGIDNDIALTLRQTDYTMWEILQERGSDRHD